MEGTENNTNEPFTVEENIQQLNAIDEDIVRLMNHTATSLNALTYTFSSSAKAGADDSRHSVDPAAQKEAYQSATDSFVTTLHTVDVKMKRQIFALEEAGIVDLTKKKKKHDSEVEVKTSLELNGPKPSLRPNGVGSVGNLDVGWLNSRSSKVERDMERELWEKAKGFLDEEGRNLKLD